MNKNLKKIKNRLKYNRFIDVYFDFHTDKSKKESTKVINILKKNKNIRIIELEKWKYKNQIMFIHLLLVLNTKNIELKSNDINQIIDAIVEKTMNEINSYKEYINTNDYKLAM